MPKRKLLILLILLSIPGALLIPFGIAQEDEEVIALSCTSTLIDGAVPGDVFRASCPANCVPDADNAWGTDIYSTGSEICAAAAHAGVLNLRQGGEFTIVFLGGEEEFIGTNRNGIASRDYQGWDLTFGFSETIACSTNANNMQGDIGTRQLVTCEAGCNANPVWGGEIYRDDSSLCSAAAHTGAISLEEGGTFIVTREEGQTSYTGSESNGIESDDWGESSFSFSISAADNVLMTCNSSAFYFAGEVGDSYTMTCPANCPASYIWGTDTYIDDSNVCTAAAHAGVISLEEGGTFTLTFEEGQTGYTGTERNGITSLDFSIGIRSFSISGE